MGRQQRAPHATPQQLKSVNWTDHHVTRALRAMARLMDLFDDQAVEPVRKGMRRDGCRVDDEPTPRVGVARRPGVYSVARQWVAGTHSTLEVRGQALQGDEFSDLLSDVF